jgi:acetyl esterase/lipase
MKLASRIAPVLTLAALAFGAGSAAAQDNVQTKKDVEYAIHDGVSLKGDLYLPATGGAHPAMLFIHGGGFRGGSKTGYGNTWGPYLAARGIMVFAIDYRLSTATQATWPQALLDCKAAVQYLRGDAAELGADADRIGVGGDSAGGSLAALVAITQDAPAFANRYPTDAYASASTRVKVAVPIYGVYDMLAWEKYTSQQNNGGVRPLEQFFGGPPDKVPGAFFEASPISYMREAAASLGAVATSNPATKIPWFLAWGMVDGVVPPAGQSVPFMQALRDAGVNVTAIPVPNVDHFWFTSSAITGKQGEPHCEEQAAGNFKCAGATPNDFIATELLAFLSHNL